MDRAVLEGRPPQSNEQLPNTHCHQQRYSQHWQNIGTSMQEASCWTTRRSTVTDYHQDGGRTRELDKTYPVMCGEPPGPGHLRTLATPRTSASAWPPARRGSCGSAGRSQHGAGRSSGRHPVHRGARGRAGGLESPWWPTGAYVCFEQGLLAESISNLLLQNLIRLLSGPA